MNIVAQALLIALLVVGLKGCLEDCPQFQCAALRDYTICDFNVITLGSFAADTGDVEGA